MAFLAEYESIPDITQKRLELDDLAGRAQDTYGQMEQTLGVCIACVTVNTTLFDLGTCRESLHPSEPSSSALHAVGPPIPPSRLANATTMLPLE